jgi:hypothetical protein
VRIKVLPLSQSKHEKRIEGVITIQRGKDFWNQRPQTSGSSTHHSPVPPLQRTTATHAPFCSTPTPSSPATGPPSPCHTCCLVSPTPSPLLRNRTPSLAYKTPHQLPQLPSRSKQSTLQINPLCHNRKQPHFPLPRL